MEFEKFKAGDLVKSLRSGRVYEVSDDQQNEFVYIRHVGTRSSIGRIKDINLELVQRPPYKD